MRVTRGQLPAGFAAAVHPLQDVSPEPTIEPEFAAAHDGPRLPIATPEHERHLRPSLSIVEEVHTEIDDAARKRNRSRDQNARRFSSSSTSPASLQTQFGSQARQRDLMIKRLREKKLNRSRGGRSIE